MDRPSQKQRMLAGELYLPNDPELVADRMHAQEWLCRYNAAAASASGAQQALLVERLAAVGRGSVVRAPFFCDYGYNIAIGDDVFVNFNCVILDVVRVTIGDRTQIGPAVQIYAADHPREAERRRRGFEFGRPVTIGCDVWIGGGVILLPGVSVADGATIGAGSVVTKNVPAAVTVAGNPARLLG